MPQRNLVGGHAQPLGLVGVGADVEQPLHLGVAELFGPQEYAGAGDQVAGRVAARVQDGDGLGGVAAAVEQLGELAAVAAVGGFGVALDLPRRRIEQAVGLGGVARGEQPLGQRQAQAQVIGRLVDGQLQLAVGRVLVAGALHGVGEQQPRLEVLRVGVNDGLQLHGRLADAGRVAVGRREQRPRQRQRDAQVVAGAHALGHPARGALGKRESLGDGHRVELRPLGRPRHVGQGAALHAQVVGHGVGDLLPDARGLRVAQARKDRRPHALPARLVGQVGDHVRRRLGVAGAGGVNGQGLDGRGLVAPRLERRHDRRQRLAADPPRDRHRFGEGACVGVGLGGRRQDLGGAVGAAGALPRQGPQRQQLARVAVGERIELLAGLLQVGVGRFVVEHNRPGVDAARRRVVAAALEGNLHDLHRLIRPADVDQGICD